MTEHDKSFNPGILSKPIEPEPNGLSEQTSQPFYIYSLPSSVEQVDWLRLTDECNKLLVRYGIDPYHAEDLTNNTFLSAITHWATIENPGGYIQRALFNQRAQHFREEQRANELGLIYLSPEHLHSSDKAHRTTSGVSPDHNSISESSVPDPLSQKPYNRVEILIDLASGLRDLTQDQQTVIYLRYLQDKPIAETAAQLGITEGAVKQRAGRGLANLRKRLGDGTGE